MNKNYTYHIITDNGYKAISAAEYKRICSTDPEYAAKYFEKFGSELVEVPASEHAAEEKRANHSRHLYRLDRKHGLIAYESLDTDTILGADLIPDRNVFVEDDAILKVMQKGQWSRSTIEGILRNEKYIGDALLQKTYVTDCISKKVKKNNGELPQYYVKDNHPAIIERNIFTQVQEELARRNSKPKVSQKASKTNRGKFSSQYALTELLYCGECGTPYRRCTWARNGQKKIVWRCINRLENGKTICKDSPTIPEGELHDAILRSLRLLAAQQDEIQEGLQEALRTAVSDQGGESPDSIDRLIAEQSDRRSAIVKKMVENGEDESHYLSELTLIANAINTLRLRKAEIEQDARKHENTEARLAAMRERLCSADLNLDAYDDMLVKQMVESIKVLSREKLLIRFKNGIEMTMGMMPME